MARKPLFEVHVNVNADGALRSPRNERLALFMADGLPIGDAWKALGAENTGNSVKYRARVVRSPAFTKRLEGLMAEKEALERDPIWGEAEFMTMQLYRHACVANDLGAMKTAVEMRFKVAERRAKYAEMANAPETPPDDPENPETAPIKRGVGRPPSENPQTKRDRGALRRELLEKGLPMDITDTAGEA